MNFKSKNGPPPRVEPEIVSLKQMADELGVPETESPLKYAPPGFRERARRESMPPVEATGLIKSFGEIPSKEIDDLIAAADAEWANCKREAQVEKDRHAAEIKRVQNNVERFKQGVALYRDALKSARDQVSKLDEAIDAPDAPDNAA